MVPPVTDIEETTLLRRLLRTILSVPKLERKNDSLREETSKRLLEIGADTLVVGLIIGSIYLIEFILNGLLGPNKKFFGVLPVVWIIDVGHLLALLKFIYNVLIRFKG